MPLVYCSCESQRAGDPQEQAQLPRWVAARAKQLNLELDDAANQVLCYCYEGNLLALAQHWSVYRYLAGRQLTLPRVEQAVNDAAHFTLSLG